MADLFAPVTLGPLLPTTTPLEPDLRQDGGSDMAVASTLAPAPQSDLSALELVGIGLLVGSRQAVQKPGNGRAAGDPPHRIQHPTLLIGNERAGQGALL